MKEMTKLCHERNRRLRLFAVTMLATAAVECFYVGIIDAKHFALSNTEFLVLCGLTFVVAFLMLGYLLSANDAYRVCKEEVVRQVGHVPFSTTYYSVQHYVYWWMYCRTSKGKPVRFHTKKGAYDMMNAKIKEWNSPYVPHNKRTRQHHLGKKTSPQATVQPSQNSKNPAQALADLQSDRNKIGEPTVGGQSESQLQSPNHKAQGSDVTDLKVSKNLTVSSDPIALDNAQNAHPAP